MIHRLGFRRNPGKYLSVVATCATADNARMHHHAGVRSVSGTMASRAYHCRRHVPDRWGGQVGHQECGRRRMAGRTIRAGRHVRGGRITFLFGCDAHGKGLPVVALRAVADDAGVVHHRRRVGGRGRNQKSTRTGTGRRMAEFTWHAGRHVARWYGLGCDADKGLSNVAARASGDDAGVIHHPRNKVGLVMAQRTGLLGRQVIRRHQAARCELFPVCGHVAAVA